jgi:hypothetical protein
MGFTLRIRRRSLLNVLCVRSLLGGRWFQVEGLAGHK